MISKFKELFELFNEIDKTLKEKTSIFIIGGAALLYFGIGKGYTKDVDIILKNRNEFDMFRQSLINLEFKTTRTPLTYNQLEIWEILERDDFRFDLFVKIVCGDFSLSDTMINKSKEVVALTNFSVYVCSMEDVMIFKSLTERPNDVEDSVDLIRRGIDWNVIYDELLKQVEICQDKLKRKRMIWYFIERMQVLKDRGVVIPIEEKVSKLYNGL